MPFLDERGRLFGRWNFIDAIVALIVLAMVGFTAVGYELFRLPRTPVVDALEPASIVEMQEQRVQLKGRNFLPYLRAFLRRTDGKDFVKRPGEMESQDAFTLVNNTQVPFLLETPTFAELKVPALPPGTYDIHFYDDSREVAVKSAALVVTKRVQSGPQWQPTGSLLAYGVFTNLRPEDTAAIHVGAHIVSGGVTWGDVLAVEPSRPDVAPLTIDGRLMPTSVIGRVQIPAKLRVRCVIDAPACRVEGAQVAPNIVLSGTIGAQPATFRVTDVGSEAPALRDIGAATFQK